MTPAQYRAILARLSLNQREAADLLGVRLKTSQAWAQGTRNMPEVVARFLRLIEDIGLDAARKACN